MQNFRKIFTGTLFALLALSNFLPAQAYNYSLSWTNPASHIYQVSLRTQPLPGPNSDFQIPAWRPGRYYLQDYAAAVLNFSAADTKGKSLSWEKIDNNTWRVQNPAEGEVVISYEYYANTMDAGSSVLNASQAYFNPVNLFMHLRGSYMLPCTLAVDRLPENWASATALNKMTGNHNVFTASDYHEFVDSPTILSPTLKTLRKEIEGTTFSFHFQGEFKGDKATETSFLTDMEKLIREQRTIFGDFPMKQYHFIYQLLPYNMGHAVEHKNSACFAMPNTVSANSSTITRLYSISSHEFFHLWNVKRIRPAMLWPYDYQREIPTTLHWFTEGVTDYYTSLTLTRAGLYSRETFMKVLSRTIQSLEANYASQIVSPSKASMDSWLERSDYTPPFGRISYYTLGTRVGLLLDLKIRAVSAGKLSFDDVFLNLYKEYFQKDRGMEEDAVEKMVEAATKQSFKAFFADHVNGTAAIDYASFLTPFGLELIVDPLENSGWQRAGLEQIKEMEDGIFIAAIRPKSDAEKAGLGDQMLIMEVDGKPAKDFDDKAFFDKYKKPKTLKLKVATEAGIQDVELVWTNAYSPANYTVQEMEKANSTQKEMLESWLKSRQN